MSTSGAEAVRSTKGRSVAKSIVAVALRMCGAGAVSTVGAGGLSGCAYDDSCYDRRLCLTPPTSLCDGDPTAAPALDECGIFVSASSGDDASPGTKGAPVRTLQHAIGLAAHGRGHGEAATRRVYACGGEFAETITLPSGVDLRGGRLCDGGDWSYEGSFGGPDHPTIIAPPAGIPVRVLGGENATSTISGVYVVAADASASDGKSSIAMILSPGAGAIVRESAIVAGNGKDGEPGEDADSERAKDGVEGNDGASACTADAAVGALPVATVCDGGIESTGGYGGDGGRESGGDGAPGQPGPAENPEGYGRAGLGAAGSEPCTVGTTGTDGTDGGRAAGAAGPGQLTERKGWVGVRGQDGTRGGAGQGGGGGGGSKGRGDMVACRAGTPQAGAAGGSGGSGGCGGEGGKGGGYGGASIGVVALQGSALTLEATSVKTGNGGHGGVGGTGQPGGGGGWGGDGGKPPVEVNRLWPACPGGGGGNGGRGGDAGGGLGGPSYGVASVAARVEFGPYATVAWGAAGYGGAAGNAAPEDDAGKGAVGDNMPWRQFDVPNPEPPR